MELDEIVLIIFFCVMFSYCGIFPLIAVLFEQYKFNAMLKKISFTQPLCCYI